MTDSRLSLEALAQVPAWSPDRVAAIGGRIRGALLKDWGTHIARRWGVDALATLRRELAIDVGDLPDAPERTPWYPVRYQVLITRYVADVFAGGDLLAVEGLIEQDTHRGTAQAVTRWAARRVGVRRVIKSAPKLHAEVYDVGVVSVDVGRGRAMLSFRDASLFGAPTWRVLQLFALRGLVHYMGKAVVESWGTDVGEAAFDAGIRWR